MGKVTVVGGKVGMNEPSLYDPVFANNTWSEIIEACQKNKVPDKWVVGDNKIMTINGTDHQIDIIGKNHDTYSVGGTAPLTLQLHDCYSPVGHKMNSSKTNSGGWTSSAMRTSTLPGILDLMPNEVRSGVKEVNKVTSAGNQSSTLNTTADKLFLLSTIEVLGTEPNSYSGEGVQYAYYASGNSAIKNRSGTAVTWWLRSPAKSGTSFFDSISNDGTATPQYANSIYGVSFAFCF